MFKKLLSLSLAVAMILSLGIVSAYGYETTALFTTDFNTDGTLSGLGGKAEDDLSYSYASGGSAYTLPYGHFRSGIAAENATEALTGYVTVEASVLFNDVSSLAIKAHTKNSSGHVLADATVVTYEPADENRWHRVVWEYYGTESSTLVNVYIDGELVNYKSSSYASNWIQTFKLVPTLASETGYLAIDDIVTYREAYTPAELTVTHTANSKVSYDADSAYFSIENGAAVSDITSNLTLADGVTATVYSDGTFETVLSESDLIAAGNIVVITDGVNFKYCEIGGKKALLTTDYNTDGTLSGLGGKAEDDLSNKATSSFTVPNGHYQGSVGHGSNSTDVLTDYVTVEASVLFSDVDTLAIKAHTKNSGHVFANETLNTYTVVDENRWHRIAWEYYGTDTATTLTAYIDGVQVYTKTQSAASYFINSLSLVPTISSETGYLAVDDIVTYRSAYEASDLSFTLNENDKTRYNAETGVIEYLEGATASDVSSNITAADNITVKVYTDNTFKTEAQEITADSVVLLTDGTAYKYISVSQVETFEEEEPEPDPVVTVKENNYTSDGTLSGLGGKDSSDASLEVTAGTNYDVHMMYRFDGHAQNSTEVISGYVTTEYSMLIKDAETVSFIRRVRNTTETDGAKTTTDAIGYGAKTYTPADTNKWHRVVWELYVDETLETPTTLKVYIDDELFWSMTGSEAATWIEYLRVNPDGGSIAIDDVKVHQEAYTPSTLAITYTDNDKATYNAETSAFKVNGATVSDIKSNLTLADGVTAKVYADGTYSTILSDTETLKAGNAVVVTDGVNFRYASVTDKDIINSYNYNTDGTLAGLGGKEASDMSKEIAQDGTWDAEYAYRITGHGTNSTEVISGYITTEYSMLINDAQTINFVRRVRNTTETDGTKTTTDAIGYASKTYTPADTNRWHRVAWELYVDETAETPTTLNVYIDGEVFWSMTGSTAATWVEYLRIAPKGGSVAVDDLIVYRGKYAYEDVAFNFADSENVTYSADENMFLFKSGATASEITSNISGLSGSVKLYTDNTFAQELNADTALVNKAVAVFTSADGSIFKYADIRIDDFVKYTYTDSKTVRLVEKENTFVYAYGAKVSDLTANFTAENGTTIAVYENADSDTALDSAASLSDGNVVVLTSPLGYETETFEVKNKLYIGHFPINFEEESSTGLTVQNGKEQYITATEFKAGMFGKTSASKAEVITAKGGPIELSNFEETTDGARIAGLNTGLTETITMEFSAAIEGEYDHFEIIAQAMYDDSTKNRSALCFFSTKDSYELCENDWFKANGSRWYKFSVTIRPAEMNYDVYINGEKIIENEPIPEKTDMELTGIQYYRMFVSASETSDYTFAADDISVYYGEYDMNPDSQAVIVVADGSDAVIRNDMMYMEKVMSGDEEIGYDPNEYDSYPFTALNGAKIGSYAVPYEENFEGYIMNGDTVVIESKDGTTLKYYKVSEPELVADNIVLTIDGKRAGTIAAGTVTASLNAYAPEALSKNATLYFAFYKDNKLLDLVSDEKAILGETTYSASKTLTDTEGVTVKAMFLDDNLKPLTDYKTFTE